MLGQIAKRRLAPFGPRRGILLLTRCLVGSEPERVDDQNSEGLDGPLAVDPAPTQELKDGLAEPHRVGSECGAGQENRDQLRMRQ